jgi:hypothetical protein
MMKRHSEKVKDVVVNGWLLNEPKFKNWFNELDREKDNLEDYLALSNLFEQYEQKRHAKEEAYTTKQSAVYVDYIKANLEEQQLRRMQELKTNFSTMESAELLKELHRRNGTKPRYRAKDRAKPPEVRTSMRRASILYPYIKGRIQLKLNAEDEKAEVTEEEKQAQMSSGEKQPGEEQSKAIEGQVLVVRAEERPRVTYVPDTHEEPIKSEETLNEIEKAKGLSSLLSRGAFLSPKHKKVRTEVTTETSDSLVFKTFTVFPNKRLSESPVLSSVHKIAKVFSMPIQAVHTPAKIVRTSSLAKLKSPKGPVTAEAILKSDEFTQNLFLSRKKAFAELGEKRDQDIERSQLKKQTLQVLSEEKMEEGYQTTMKKLAQARSARQKLLLLKVRQASKNEAVVETQV